MGTRINVILEHRVADYRDCAAVVDLLAPTLPEAFAVADYWRTVDPDYAREPQASWSARPPAPSLEYSTYWGPGSLFIDVGARAAMIFTGGRWRGFLAIEPLRRVHLAAIRSIAGAFGSKRLVYFPSEGVADHLFPFEDLTQAECIEKLQQSYGDPQPSVEDISPEIVAETERCAPAVWFVETMRTGGELNVQICATANKTDAARISKSGSCERAAPNR